MKSCLKGETHLSNKKFTVLLSHDTKLSDEKLTDYVLLHSNNPIAGYTAKYLALKAVEGITKGLIESDIELDKSVVISYSVEGEAVDFREEFKIPDEYELELMYTMDSIIMAYPQQIMMGFYNKNPTAKVGTF